MSLSTNGTAIASLLLACLLPFLTAQRAGGQVSLPDAPAAQTGQSSGAISAQPGKTLTLSGTPKRLVFDELHVLSSPARIRTKDLVWLLPVAGATAASLATDSYAMRNVVTHDAGFNSTAVTSSDVLRGAFIGAPVLLFGAGEFAHQAKAR